MGRVLEWLDVEGVKTKRIGVVEGNENVLEFYKKYGFYKKVIILEEILINNIKRRQFLCL